jgi:hypothetical protein
LRFIHFEQYGNVYRMDTETGRTCRLDFNEWVVVADACKPRKLNMDASNPDAATVFTPEPLRINVVFDAIS